jgi:lauroyl/myristoyl acyltransferase
LKRGNAVIMAADVVWNSSSVPVTFFSEQYNMSRVPASLSVRTKAALLPVITIRNNNGTYKVVIGEPVDWSTAFSRPETERQITEFFAKFLEQHVRRRPEQWGWTHRVSWLPHAAPVANPG